MRSTSARDDSPAKSSRPRIYRQGWLFAFVLLAAALSSAGCVEFVHWGHISDREGTWGIGGVEISQKQADGTWKTIGKSDGKGKWEVFKNTVSGGGKIRLRKPGYYTITMPESEFMQQHLILMQATGEAGYGEQSDPIMWRRGGD